MKSHAPNTSSRTFFGIRNGQVGFLYYLASLFIGFISRKFFLDYLGAEFLGLNTTAENLLGILNLSELGIGMAVAYTLYKPLLQHDEGRIHEIITLQGWMYRRIGWMVGMSALILMLFFPHIFSKTDLPLGYAYATFGVFLYSTLLTYFFNYKQILFSSNQQQYQIILHYQSILLLKNIVQILAFLCLPSPYISWLLLQVVFATVASAQLHRAVNKHFPFLEKSAQDARTLMKRYPHLLTQIKQVFFHRLASFALTQSSPLIIFAYANLTLVALYGNYQLICLTVQKLVDSLFTGVHAGIGHLIAENNPSSIPGTVQHPFLADLRLLLLPHPINGTFHLPLDWGRLCHASQYTLSHYSHLVHQPLPANGRNLHRCPWHVSGHSRPHHRNHPQPRLILLIRIFLGDRRYTYRSID